MTMPPATRPLLLLPTSWPRATTQWSPIPLTVPTEKSVERKALGDRGKHPKACYNVPDRHHRRGLSGCLPCVADTSPQVY
uniref:Putative secreted protein n=1 Tax=Amblyomma americanum TaxID=6943 RepID=A0A0C9SEI8_AMBAM